MIFLMDLIAVGLTERRVGFKKRADGVMRADLVQVNDRRPDKVSVNFSAVGLSVETDDVSVVFKKLGMD